MTTAMAMKSAILRSYCPLPLLSQAKAELPHTSIRALSPTVTCCSSSSPSAAIASRNVPKLEPFSRSKLDRALKDPPLIQKSLNELADYCVNLEGDDAYSGWRAYFELKDLQDRVSKEEVEKLILQAGGVKSLIGCLHGISSMHSKKEGSSGSPASGDAQQSVKKQRERLCPIPDGLPKSREEMEEDERARMPDSSYTRLLRTKGRLPAWYSLAPDHETD
ncbi:unnamed protein product [Linum trigynum]|uniref:CCG-binding protein 1 n=1 Tax=Linum trigynum TaxID=586398 RepID=A0AAV2ETN4_9ROSI